MRESRAVIKQFHALLVIGLMVAMITVPAVCASANVLGVPDSEYNALVALYNSTNGPGWTKHTSWLGGSAPWYGVIVTDGHVMSLNLAHNQLIGQIPKELGNLTYSKVLDLGNNRLTGLIPTQLGCLLNLDFLVLSDNQLTGSIPTQLGDLTNLRGLYLQSNQLTGQIPAELGHLTNSQTLDLSCNQLVGQIPAELGQLTNVESLGLSSNRLTDHIPTQLGNLTSLWMLDLGDNQLTGQIPAELGNLTGLYYLWLYSNRLTGDIPTSLTNLAFLASGDLALDYNALTASDASLCSFLAATSAGWQNTQTVPPSNVTVASGVSGSVTVSWNPIAYIGEDGHYEIGISQTPGGPYIFSDINSSIGKAESSVVLTGLSAGSKRYFVVRTITPASSQNQSTLTSLSSTEVSVMQPTNPVYVRISVLTDSANDLTCPNPVRVGGRVISASPLKINDGSGEIAVSGMNATVGQFVFVTGNWDGSMLSVLGSPVVYNTTGQ